MSIDMMGVASLIVARLSLHDELNLKPFFDLIEVQPRLQIGEMEEIVPAIARMDEAEAALRHFLLDNTAQYLPELATAIAVGGTSHLQVGTHELLLIILLLGVKLRSTQIVKKLPSLAPVKGGPRSLVTHVR